MKRSRIVLLTLLIGAIVIWEVGRFSGMLGLFTVPSSSNEPNIKTNSHIWVTNLIRPERLDFMCFKGLDPLTGESEVRVHRLCALEGDLVEIKDGKLFVNKVNIDSALELNQIYKVHISELRKLDDPVREKIEEVIVFGGNRDSILITTSHKFIITHQIKANKYVISADSTDEYILKVWKQKWNRDQFGPVRVPDHCYFVLGDNRCNSMDSRYLGFIPNSNFVGTVLR